MAVAFHSGDIEVREEDEDEEGDDEYDDIDVQVAEEDYAYIDAQNAEEGAAYENVDARTPTRLKRLTKKRKSVTRQFKLLGLGLGLLCVVQVLRLSIYSEWMKEKDNLVKDLEQIQSRYDNLTGQKDQIQSRYDNLTVQKDQIQSRYGNLTRQKNQIQSRYDNLTVLKDQMQSRDDNLTVQNDQLKSRYDNLTNQKDQLQSRYTRLIENPDELKRIRCEPHGFTFNGGVCYYKSNVRKTWEKSRQACRDKQSDMIIINSKEKEDLLVRVEKGYMWIGLTDAEEEGQFKWVDGTPLTSPTFWRPGQPDGGDLQDCVYYRGSDSAWADDKCSQIMHWMCERVV